jgi:hypothetical protein
MKTIDTVDAVTGVAKAESRPTLAVENAQAGLSVKRQRCKPGQLRTDVAEAVWTKGASENDGIIDKSPGVRVLGVLPAECGEELPGF